MSEQRTHSSVQKRELLQSLALKRRVGRQWPKYKKIGCYHGGAYECDHVSPYTKTAGNVNASVLVILQDWASDKFLAGTFDPELRDKGRSLEVRSNRTLERLLREHFDLALAETYATNLFPFVKPGKMNSRVPQEDLRRVAEEFAWPQVEIVQPRLVVCLGLSVFNAISNCLGAKRHSHIQDAITTNLRYNGIQIYCQAHPGPQGQNNRNRGGIERVRSDWKQMKRAYDGLPNA